MDKKRMLVGALVLFGGFLAYASVGKITNAEKVVGAMEFSLQNMRHIRIQNGALKLDVDVVCSNPSSYDLSVNSVGLIQAKTYRVYLNNNMISFGNMNNISGIDLPAGGTYIFDSITVEMPLMNIGVEVVSWLFENESFLQGLDKETLMDKLEKVLDKIYFEVDVDAMGTIATFKSKLI